LGKLLQPNDLAKECSINKSTLNGYLKDKEMFPPIRINQENGYRYYPENMVLTLKLFRALKKKPFRLREYEIKEIFIELDLEHIVKLHSTSDDLLFNYLKDNGKI